MLSRTIYYALKPFIPWDLRMWLRRRHAAAQRAAHGDVWPTNEKAGFTPPNWPGWPDGKQFAIVLTHDVEGSKGLLRVEDMMRLEQKCGYKSSFNFVPEGEYRVPDALRHTLGCSGFEVGVHGLHHDGKLYASKREFGRRAARIREYASRWGASGFRSPFMQHNLAWLHELGLEYDASTFDTDPFEPQPDAAETIFPFWVARPDGAGYVELPYTLVQDSTLFTVLEEKNIDIWKRKLDWIAAHGGMALLNTHPDYACFEGRPGKGEFPAVWYEEFLRYATERYGGQFWQALPRDVARYYCASLPVSARNTRKQICMLTYSGYEFDNRVRRYAETLAARGDRVDVIALAHRDQPVGSAVLKGVNIQRIQSRNSAERSQLEYLFRLLRFFASSRKVMARQHARKRYDVIHVHNMPDFLVFAAWAPKRAGAKIILDIHDIMPELYVSKFRRKPSDPVVRLLLRVEKMAGWFSDHVIISNDLWRNRLMARSVPGDRCSVFVNHIDPAIFYRRERSRDDGKTIILFPGTFQWHQGLDIAIKAFDRIRERVPNAELHFYGRGQEQAALIELCEQLKLTDRVRFFSSVDLDKIPEVIANADVGIVPKRANSFGDEAYSTKIMEFMSQGVPVVASRTKIDQFYFDDSVIRFFPSGDDMAMAEAMMEVIENHSLRRRLVGNAQDYAERNSWNSKKAEYLNLVDALSTEVFSPEIPAEATVQA